MTYTRETKWLLDIKYNGQANHDFYADVRKLKDGVPIDYLIGYSDFLDCKIYLDNCPLIPRTETEYWVSRFIKENLTNKETEDVALLDLFSGSGCIGVALLHHDEDIKVTFAEQDKDLLNTIEKNAKENGIPRKRYSILKSDVFSNIEGKFNFILANPPYIDKQRKETEEPVLEHEPHSALFAPEEGLFFIKKLIVEAPRFLTPGGSLYIEFDSWQKDEIANYVQSLPDIYTDVEFISDQFARPRTVRLTLAK